MGCAAYGRMRLLPSIVRQFHHFKSYFRVDLLPILCYWSSNSSLEFLDLYYRYRRPIYIVPSFFFTLPYSTDELENFGFSHFRLPSQCRFKRTMSKCNGKKRNKNTRINQIARRNKNTAKRRKRK